MRTTSRLGLKVWAFDDNFNHLDLANNWDAIDAHDHATAGGVPIDVAALTAAVKNQLVPVGGILPFAGSTSAQPAGFLICNGQSIPTANYAALFGVIGYTYGGSGTTFNIPDLRGRVAIGLGQHADVDVLGDNDGATITNRRLGHTHTVNAHTHTVNSHTHTGPAHGHTIANGGFFQKTYTLGTTGAPFSQQVMWFGGADFPNGALLFTDSQGTGATGSASPGTDAQSPGTSTAAGSYLTLNYIIKA